MSTANASATAVRMVAPILHGFARAAAAKR